jgi:ubiquinone/menaquinone biosynthesis C-methylase UbiE
MKLPSPLIHWTPKRYDSIAKYYDWMARLFPVGKKGHERALDGLVEGFLIDVACGTGTLLAMALGKGMKCYGVDTSSGMLDQAMRKAPGAQFVRASFYEIPYSEGTFDYVIETNAVSGVEIEVVKVLQEMIRVCKTGGEIRLVDYAKPVSPTNVSRTIERILHWIGDFAYDYVEYFNSLGYDPKVHEIGWGGMYQFIQVVKR